MTIRIYPSALPGEPIETHEARGTLHEWLIGHCPSYRPNGGEQPIVVFVGGEQVEPSEWSALDCGNEIEIRPKARGFDPITIAIIAFVAAVARLLGAGGEPLAREVFINSAAQRNSFFRPRIITA